MGAANVSRVVFKLSNRELSNDVTLTPQAWRVLAQCDGVHTVAEIAKSLGLDEPAVAQAAETLFRCGMLQVAAGSVTPSRPTVSGVFFDHVTSELARAIGPLAALTLEDEVAALGEARESFPRDRIAELIERLGHTIREDARRLRFQQVMLEAIRKL